MTWDQECFLKSEEGIVNAPKYGLISLSWGRHQLSAKNSRAKWRTSRTKHKKVSLIFSILHNKILWMTHVGGINLFEWLCILITKSNFNMYRIMCQRRLVYSETFFLPISEAYITLSLLLSVWIAMFTINGRWVRFLKDYKQDVCLNIDL